MVRFCSYFLGTLSSLSVYVSCWRPYDQMKSNSLSSLAFPNDQMNLVLFVWEYIEFLLRHIWVLKLLVVFYWCILFSTWKLDLFNLTFYTLNFLMLLLLREEFRAGALWNILSLHCCSDWNWQPRISSQSPMPWGLPTVKFWSHFDFLLALNGCLGRSPLEYVWRRN